MEEREAKLKRDSNVVEIYTESGTPGGGRHLETLLDISKEEA